MTYQRGTLATLVFLLIMMVDLLIVSSIPGLRLFLNLTLLTVIGLTIGERFLIGFGAAILAGIVYSQFSVLSGPIYIIAFVTAVVVSWLFSRKIVSTHSMISFLTTIMVGTSVFTLTIILVDFLATVFERQRLHLDVPTALLSGLIQICIHPLLLGLLWRMVGRHQYHHISTLTSSSF